MPRLFWGNYEFEEDLAGVQQNLPQRLQRLNAELACCWMAVAEEGDRIWCPQSIGGEFFASMSAWDLPEVRTVTSADEVPPGLELVPWGWSDRALSFAEGIGAAGAAPPREVVRVANSRQFSLNCEIEWGLVPRGVSAVKTLSELDRLLRESFLPCQRWILKAEFSHAARRRVLGEGPELTANQAQWAAKRIRRDDILFLEPWLERCAEAGLQWTIPESGPPVLEGVTPLLTDANGQYIGSRFGVDEGEIRDWESAVKYSERAVRRLQAIGYHGPVGIDAMLYRDREGEVRLRPLQDINARWTMGRLSLGWRRLAASGTWKHGTRQQFNNALRKPSLRCVSTSPQTIHHQDVEHVTWLEFDD